MAILDPSQPDGATLSHSHTQVRELAHLSPEEYARKERTLKWKLDLRLMPVLFVIIVLK
jgi:hypothetical protein